MNIYFAVPQFCGRITAITFAQSNFIVAFAVAAAAAVLTIMGPARDCYFYIIASADVLVAVAAVAAAAVSVAVAIVIVVVSVAKCVCSIFKICKIS